MPGHYGMMEAKGKEKMARKAKGKKSAPKKNDYEAKPQ
jgi:hypothetical protein